MLGARLADKTSDLETRRGERRAYAAGAILAPQNLTARRIDSHFFRRGCDSGAVGKRCGRRSSAQRFINKRLADAARRHRVVVRLKGGDPMLFGRAHEEISYLRAKGVRVEVVPGVTAALAAAAEIGVSLTRRGKARSITFVTPRQGAGERPSGWVDA